ncbi:unnamed protein product [Ixodes persulcatus]
MSMDFAAKFQQESMKYQLIRRILLFSVVYTTTLGALCSMFGNPASYILLEHLQEQDNFNGQHHSWFRRCFPNLSIGRLSWPLVSSSNAPRFNSRISRTITSKVARCAVPRHRSVGTPLSRTAKLFMKKCVYTVILCVPITYPSLLPSFWSDTKFCQLSTDKKEGLCVYVCVFFFSNRRKKNHFSFLLSLQCQRHNFDFSSLFHTTPTQNPRTSNLFAPQKSGMAAWLSGLMMAMRSWNPIVVQVVLMVVTTLVTEVNNDAATASVLIPIACDLAESSRVNPLYYSFPVSVACSTGLLLPVASVPMALAHEALLGYEASKMVGRARAARRSLALGSFFSLKF